MLTPDRLHDIAAFSDCKCPASTANMERARKYLGELIDFTSQLLEEDMRHLSLLEFKAGREENQDVYETAQATLKARQAMLEALHGGRMR